MPRVVLLRGSLQVVTTLRALESLLVRPLVNRVGGWQTAIGT